MQIDLMCMPPGMVVVPSPPAVMTFVCFVGNRTSMQLYEFYNTNPLKCPIHDDEEDNDKRLVDKLNKWRDTNRLDVSQLLHVVDGLVIGTVCTNNDLVGPCSDKYIRFQRTFKEHRLFGVAVKWWLGQANRRMWRVFEWNRDCAPIADECRELVVAKSAQETSYKQHYFDQVMYYAMQKQKEGREVGSLWIGLVKPFCTDEILFMSVAMRMDKFVFWEKRRDYFRFLPVNVLDDGVLNSLSVK